MTRETNTTLTALNLLSHLTHTHLKLTVFTLASQLTQDHARQSADFYRVIAEAVVHVLTDRLKHKAIGLSGDMNDDEVEELLETIQEDWLNEDR